MGNCNYVSQLTFSFSDDKNAGISGLHPPNLVNQDGDLHPNALVPFCAYQTKMLGERVQTLSNHSFIACSHFKPSILDGQLCYSFDVSEVAKDSGGKVKSGAGKGNGLLLIIDSTWPNQPNQENVKVAKNIDLEITTLNLEETSKNSQAPKIYMNTLERFQTFQTGSFALSSLKKMTGSDNYLSSEDKDCSVETFEDCQARRYLEELEKQCGCVPWPFARGNTFKVIFIYVNAFFGKYMHDHISEKLLPICIKLH